MRISILVASVVLFASWLPETALAQSRNPSLRNPSVASFEQADALVDTVFTALEAGDTEFLAAWLNDKVGAYSDAATRVRQINEYRSHLDILLLAPPEGTWGPLAGYDLIQESILPGSDRFFRRLYMAYHEGAPIIWEFLFYVRPDKRVVMYGWNNSPENPFVYLSTPDMLLTRWYE